MRWGVLVTAAALGLAACGKSSAPAAGASAPAPTNAPPANMTPAVATNASSPAEPVNPSFKISVTLSSAAARQLASLGQDLIISADFYGQANAPGAGLADDMGQISLANEVRVTIAGAGGSTIIMVPRLNPSKLADIQNGDPQLLINVFSGEGLNPDNKIDCGLFQDRLALAEQAGVQITCKLIGET